MEEFIDESVAQEEVNAWLDHKRIKPRKRKANEDAIAELVDGVVYGQLTINQETFVITQHLEFPIGDEVKTSELEFKPRVRVADVNSKLKAVKAGDVDARLLAYASALTGKPVALLAKMDTIDNTLAQNIAVFFL